MNLLQWHNLQNLPLIKPCHGNIAAGDCIALSGASGSGKSLLCRALAGIDPCTFDKLYCQDISFTQTAASVWRQSVCYVGQHAYFIESNTLDALQKPFSFRAHRAQHFDRTQIIAWLDVLGKAESILDQPTSALSGGERQIIHILRSLQFAPTILLLDEPTAALDHDAALAFEALISEWRQASAQRAVLWISHDDNQIERIATRHWHMINHQLITDPVKS